MKRLFAGTRTNVGLAGTAIVLALLLAAPMQSAFALGGGSGAVSLGALGTAYTQNFDTLANTGTTNTLTINGWFLNETGTSARNNGQYGASTGSDASGDVYSFGATANTERAFGTLFSGTLSPAIGAQFTNNTGSTVTQLDVSYTGEMWRAGVTNRNAADRLDFQLSTNATDLATGTWTDYNGLDFSSPNINTTAGALNGNSSGNQTAVSASITGVSIANGASFWIRWTDPDIAPGADDGLAVDDFSLTPRLSVVPTGTGAATPPSAAAGNTTLLTVAVTPGTSPTSTGITVTCNLSTIGGSSTQTLYDDGTNGDQTLGDNTFSYLATVGGTPGPKTLPCTIADAQARSSATSIAFIVEGPFLPIHAIQGASHISPVVNGVFSTAGIVTSETTSGFWIQDPNPDASDATSEGIFVFTSTAPTVSVGDSVRVSGTVQEFRPGGASTANLTTTEIARQAITVLSSGNPLPPPTIAGIGGRIPPGTVIEDDAAGDVETSGLFDPATDGLDFWESLEGMRVQLNNPVAVGPTNAFGETPVVGDNGATASLRTARGGLIIQPTDFNPERVVLDGLPSVAMPAVNVGDHYLGAVTGVLDYNFGNFFLEASAAPPVVHDGVTQETTATPSANELAVATFNVENLAPNDPQAKFDRLAGLIVNNLQAPDLISVEEVQDDTGATDNGVVTAGVTLTKLVAAITAAGGPAYQWREIDPVNDSDGGAPGGNIRQVFLFRTDRGLSFIDRPGGTSTAAVGVTGSGFSTQLTFSPGRIDPTNTAWSTSRKPLAGEFMFNGRHVFVIANHFNSKGGDNPLMGHFQPPTRISEVQRHQQAQIVHDFVAQILAADPNASVVVDGDLNDFEFSQTVTTLSAGVLQDLINTLPPNERYSYVFEGNSQTLDHILLSGALFAGPRPYDVVHVNSEFADQASDHDPSVVRLGIQPPATAIALDPATPDVNGWYVFAVKATVTATDHSGSGIAETRCVLDPPTPPASFADLPAGPCPYLAPGAYVLTEGVHTLYAGTRDNTGVTDLVSTSFKIDKTGPVATMSPLPPFQTAASFPVSWSATDNLSGVSSYDVRYRQAPSNGTFGSYTTWFSHTTATGASFTAPAGSTTCFSARATDNAGWTAAWSAEQCTTVPLDDPALARIGFWTTVTGSGYYGPGVSRSTSPGNQLSVTMRGNKIGVLVTKQPGGGSIELRWNGFTQLSASLNAASVQKQQLLTFTLGSVQTGTLAVVQTGFGTVDIDGAGAYKTS